MFSTLISQCTLEIRRNTCAQKTFIASIAIVTIETATFSSYTFSVYAVLRAGQFCSTIIPSVRFLPISLNTVTLAIMA